MKIEELKNALQAGRSKKDRLLEYLNALNFFNSKLSLKKCLKALREIEEFDVDYIYATRIVKSYRNERESNNFNKGQKGPVTVSAEKVVSHFQESKPQSEKNEVDCSQQSSENQKYKMSELIVMSTEDLPDELKSISSAEIQGQTFDVRSASYPDFKFFGSDDDEFNFVKNMESKGFKKGSEEYRLEQNQAKLKGKRRQEYREANKEFFRIAKKYIN